MNKKLRLVICTFIIAAGSTQMNAQSNKEKLVNSLFKKQKGFENDIVAMWTKNERGDKLAKLLAEYVGQEVRLNSMSSKKRNSLLVAVNKSAAKFKTPAQLAKALVFEHYRRRGIELDDKHFVDGTYHISNSSMK
ncbi:MAG: hypothetical protein HRT88_12165 [Lentisphaeraceae bacterium]|nr:hypothetical protein [Lentisphaeraceae bacterium]